MIVCSEICSWGHSLAKNATRCLSTSDSITACRRKQQKSIFWQGAWPQKWLTWAEYFVPGGSRTQTQCVFSSVSHKLAISYKLPEFNKHTYTFWQPEFWLTWCLLPSLSCLPNTFLTHSMSKWVHLNSLQITIFWKETWVLPLPTLIECPLIASSSLAIMIDQDLNIPKDTRVWCCIFSYLSQNAFKSSATRFYQKPLSKQLLNFAPQGFSSLSRKKPDIPTDSEACPPHHNSSRNHVLSPTTYSPK